MTTFCTMNPDALFCVHCGYVAQDHDDSLKCPPPRKQASRTEPLEFQAIETPPGVEKFSLDTCALRAIRGFDLGDILPGYRRDPCYLFRIEVWVKREPHPFIIGWSQPTTEPEPNPDKMLNALLRLGAYTAARVGIKVRL